MGFLGFGEKLPQAVKKENIKDLKQEINTLLKQTGYSKDEEINAGNIGITIYKDAGKKEVGIVVNRKSWAEALRDVKEYLQNIKANVSTAPDYDNRGNKAWKNYRQG